MLHSALIDNITAQTRLQKSQVQRAVDELASLVARSLAEGEEIKLPNLGSFQIISYPSKTVNHPRDPEKKLVVFPQNICKFRTAESLKQKIKDVLPSSPSILAPIANISYIDLAKITVPKEILSLVPEHLGRKYQVVPYKIDKNKLYVAMVDPENTEAIEFVKKLTGMLVIPSLSTQADINHVLDQYSGIQSEVKEIFGSTTSEDVKKNIPAQDQEIFTEDAPAAKIVSSLIKRAVRDGASDIHVEGFEESVIVRFRLDGILKKIITLPKDLQSSLISRIKILSGLKIDEQRLPQDGRFQATIDHEEVDFRVSCLPTVNGEKIVIRILNKTAGLLSLDQLGLRGKSLEALKKAISKPHGMVLVTGPTGSGKTTTLYAVISQVASEGINITTLEDPVEYHIPGINQSQVNAEINFTFANGLRSILRQDPNVIMLGEIRDEETANMAVQSALTGHLVLSTLHTNNAAGAFPRLIDMKIETFLINSTVNIVLAQRLCRKICQSCKEEVQIDPQVMQEISKDLDSLPENSKPQEIKFFKGKGCPTCSNTGYKGRIGIFEVIPLTDKIKAIVSQKESAEKIAGQAYLDGWLSLRQDGLLKAIDGLTTIDEIWRTTKEE